MSRWMVPHLCAHRQYLSDSVGFKKIKEDELRVGKMSEGFLGMRDERQSGRYDQDTL